MGVYSDRVGWKDPNGYNYSVGNTRFSFLFSTHGGGPYIVTVPASTVGFHYFIIDGLSLGGNLGYESRSGSVQAPVGRAVVSQDLGTGSTFIFEPKVGYALGLSDTLGFWFRGGLFRRCGHRIPQAGRLRPENKYTHWMVSADALFTIMPVDHVGFYVGPGLDLSFTGTYTHTVQSPPVSASYDSAYRRFKLGAGMIAYF